MLTRARIRKNSATVPKRQPTRGALKAEHGFAMVITIFIVIIFSLLGLSMMMMALYQVKDADRTKPSNRAFDLAQCGLAYGRTWLAQDNIPPGNTFPNSDNLGEKVMGSPDSKFITYVWRDTSPPYYKIRSTGTYTVLEGSESRNYARTLEERVRYSGLEGYFDCFNYLMFSKNGDINMDAGWLAANYTNMRIDGNMYAKNVTLWNNKLVAAGGTLTVNGDVYAVSDATLYANTGVLAYSGVNVNGSLTTGSNATVWGRTAVAAGADAYVKNDVNAKGSATVKAEVLAAAAASAKVGGNVNATGNILVRGYAGALAASTARVSGDAYAGGNVAVQAQDGFVTSTRATVVGDVKAVVQANMSSTSSTWSNLQARVNGNVRCNGGSALNAYGWWPADAEVRIDGQWQHTTPRSVTSNSGSSVHYGSESTTSPNLSAPTVKAVPDVDLPQPDFNWYRTMAISQGESHYNNGLPAGSGPYTVTSINATVDRGSTGEVYYYDDDLIVSNVIINTSRKGVIVVDGDFTLMNSLQVNGNAEYQVIATGDITFNTSMTLTINPTDTLFLYTNGTHKHEGTQRFGNVKYDLGWFRNISGQITCTGNIQTDSAGLWNTPIIKYKAPNVPVEAWPIPMEILRFREL